MMVEIFCERLIKARKQKRLTQKAAAASIGVQASSLSAYEGGRKTPSIEIVMQIARTYEVSIDWLTGFSDEDRLKSADEKGVQKIVSVADFLRAITALCESGIRYRVEISNEPSEFSVNAYNKTTVDLITVTDWLPTYMGKFSRLDNVIKDTGLDKDMLDAWVNKELKLWEDKKLVDNIEEKMPWEDDDGDDNIDGSKPKGNVVSNDELPF